jgi:osmoprotectant transport system ATP-binding protein
VRDNVGLPLRLRGRGRAERDAEATARLELVGLDPDRFARLMPHQLSGGQRQRVGVARALAGDPDLILMDEPFGALDPITRRELQDEFRRLRLRLKKTVVFVTHDLREACRIADRLALVDHGELVQQGAPADLVARPASDFVRDFFRDAESVVEAVPGGRE